MDDLTKLRIDRDNKPGTKRRASRLRRLAMWLLLLAGIGVGLWFYSRGELKALQPKIKVEVTTVSTAYPSQALTLFNATGYVVPQTKADIASKATGRLEKLEVEEGSRVSKGQVIARLENQDVVAAMQRAKANVAVAESAVSEARARHGETQARVAEANAELREAQHAFARAKAMVAKNYVTQEVYDAALARHDRAVAVLASAEATVAAAEAAVAATEAQVGAAEAAHEEARVAVEYTLIRAPFDGVILTKHADIGDVVAPFASTTQSKGAVVSMADLNTMQVETDVSESNLTKLNVGQPCEIQLDAIPDARLRGEVHMIVPTVDRAKATVMAKVRFVDKDDRVLPDMSARVAFLAASINPEDNTPRTVVQPEAVVNRDGASVAFRLQGDTVSQVAITGGERLGDLLIVTSGLQSGDKVVLKPSENLQDGAKVVVAKP